MILVILTSWIVCVLISPIMKVYFYEYIPYVDAFKYMDYFSIDPLMSDYWPNSLPIIFKLFYDIYDIPVFHLFFGILLKLGFLISLYLIANKITKDYFASFLSLILFIGIFKIFRIALNINIPDIPIGLMSNEIRGGIYFSFRQLGLIFSLSAFYLHWKERYLISSIILTTGLFVHPINILVFFLCMVTSTLIHSLLTMNFKGMLKYCVSFIMPVLFGAILYKIPLDAIFNNIEPISFKEHWGFIMKNEPDDVSVLYNLQNDAKLYIVTFILTVFGIFYWFNKTFQKPINKINLKIYINSREAITIIYLVIPWLFVLFGIVWESFMIPLLPDKINDIFTTLMFRRYSAVSSFIYVPIFSLFVVKYFKLFCNYIFEKSIYTKQRKNIIQNKYLLIIFTQVVFSTSLIVYFNKMVDDFHAKINFISFDHQPPEFFIYQDENINLTHSYNDQYFNPPFTISSLIDVCKYIRNNIQIDEALIIPPYIREFRALSNRQVLISEKLDGNNAPYNRKYATLYLQRFHAITKGLSYDDFEGIVFGGGQTYSKMRKQFLSLNKNNIEEISNKFPNHNYLVTEVNHFFQFPVVYKNNDFIIYDIN